MPKKTKTKSKYTKLTQKEKDKRSKERSELKQFNSYKAKIVYIRTSTTEQTPELQLRDIYTMVSKDESDVISEKKSAWKESRKRHGYIKLVQLIEKGKITDLYCWDLDRLHRNRLHLKELFEKCKYYNVTIHSFRQQWLEKLNAIIPPWGDITKEMLINVIGWLGEEESNKKSERVKLAVRKVEGQPTVSKQGKKWGRCKITDDDFDKKVLELHNEGKSIRDIRKEIIETDGKKVSVTTIYNIIQRTI